MGWISLSLFNRFCLLKVEMGISKQSFAFKNFDFVPQENSALAQDIMKGLFQIFLKDWFLCLFFFKHWLKNKIFKKHLLLKDWKTTKFFLTHPYFYCYLIHSVFFIFVLEISPHPNDQNVPLSNHLLFFFFFPNVPHKITLLQQK